MNLSEVENNILKESKSYFIKHGFNADSFQRIIKNSKYESAIILTIFPEGYFSFIKMYLKEINIKMTNESKNLNLIRLKVHERIKELCILRFKIMTKEKLLFSKIFFHLLLPINYKFSIKSLYKTIDQIWYLAGDNSTDFNFYTKRTILASIYSSTIIHFINNDNFDETIDLLNKQLKKVSKIPKVKNRFNDIMNLLPNLIRLKKNFNFTKQ